MKPVKASFSPEYARWLGFSDAREGVLKSGRNFGVDTDARKQAYDAGYLEGQETNAAVGLDLTCKVRWDNPGWGTPECGQTATHLGFWLGHQLSLCPRHAQMAANLREQDAVKWTVLPFGWEMEAYESVVA
jgi:hypothetical protein